MLRVGIVGKLVRSRTFRNYAPQHVTSEVSPAEAESGRTKAPRNEGRVASNSRLESSSQPAVLSLRANMWASPNPYTAGCLAFGLSLCATWTRNAIPALCPRG
jgi:hypothetical protein